MENRQPFELKRVMQVYNAVQVIANAGLFITVYAKVMLIIKIYKICTLHAGHTKLLYAQGFQLYMSGPWSTKYPAMDDEIGVHHLWLLFNQIFGFTGYGQQMLLAAYNPIINLQIF